MARKQKQKVTTLEEFYPPSDGNKYKSLEVYFEPKTEGQELAVELWQRSRIMFLLGPAGTGKSFLAMALALQEALRLSDKNQKGKLLLTRPMITVGEPIGFLPGNVDEKITPWLLPFHDVLGDMTFTKWEELNHHIDVEPVPIGMLRGRTIKNGVMVCSEMQNATYDQIKCAVTRLGKHGRIIIEGDPYQSDCYTPKLCPLLQIAKKLNKLDTVSVVEFDAVEDQVRDPLISDILDLI